MPDKIEIRGAKEHNLKNVDISIPKNKFVVITGLSGSGKSSLAFDTLYAEGQRRYVESLSAYARQFLQLQNKPNVESIKGLSPSIAIDQKSTSKNPRSTVGTVTEIYDYLRLLFARVGVPYSPATGKPIRSQSASQITDKIRNLGDGTKFYVVAPIVRGEKGEHYKELINLRRQGFQRIKFNGLIHELDDLPDIDKNKKNTIELIVDRLILNPEIGNSLAESVETALKYGNGIIKIETLDEDNNTKNEFVFSEKFACPESGFQIEEIEPRSFSFNSPFGACKTCEGLGFEKYLDLQLVIPNPQLSINDGAVSAWEIAKSRNQLNMLRSLSDHYKFNMDWPFENLPKKIQDIVLYGSNGEEIEVSYTEGIYSRKTKKEFEGIIPYLEEKLSDPLLDKAILDKLSKFQSLRPCPACDGYRLRTESLCVKIHKFHIGKVCSLTISDSLEWFKDLPNHLNKTHNSIADKILKEITERLQFLLNVGLDYLTLSRNSGTLSGGESQRIRLASQIGSGLTGVLYVLDEPSIGLHQCDNEKLIKTLRNLTNIGNSVIVVEHDEDTILSADHVIDVGPGAGIHGGEIIGQGTPQDIIDNKDSITGQYLKGTKFIEVRATPRQGHEDKKIVLKNATRNNLQDVSITVPLGTFTCITGVSGSGKSSLIIQTLYKAIAYKLKQSSQVATNYESITGVEYLDKIIDINQSPIGRTPRSNPATYTGAFNYIRDWFTGLPTSKARGYTASRFSFNVKGGRCENCKGDGLIKIEMHFLPDVYVPCEECDGKRYNRETLDVQYKDKSIADVLGMTVDDAKDFFVKIPSIREKLEALQDVGLGYIKIGQSATTLSGGEAQRIKLAKELSKRSTGKTIYILDEPTTGLHIHDISKLLKVLHKLVDMGNTVMVIEHNMDVIKTSDHVIDVGPGGGNKGGKIVAKGTPHDIIQSKESITGRYLKHHMLRLVKS